MVRGTGVSRSALSSTTPWSLSRTKPRSMLYVGGTSNAKKAATLDTFTGKATQSSRSRSKESQTGSSSPIEVRVDSSDDSSEGMSIGSDEEELVSKLETTARRPTQGAALMEADPLNGVHIAEVTVSTRAVYPTTSAPTARGIIRATYVPESERLPGG